MSLNSIDSELISEVIAVCNDLGHKNKSVDKKYVLNRKDSNNVIKDLIRFLRNDNKNKFLVRKQLGFSNIVDNDLIPIVEQHSLEDIQLFDKVLRLLVDLTNPSVLHFRSQKVPNDKIESQKYIELQSFLYSYKLSFGAHKRFWTVLAKHMTRILELDEDNRQIEDTLMFERILILIRNILHIPIDIESDRSVAEEDINPHDRILELLHSSGINDLILHISADPLHQEFCFHLIEIISLMFREQNAEFVAKSVSNQTNGSILETRNDYERQLDRQELKELKARDKNIAVKSLPNFSRFNGTFYIKNMKSISDRDIICHKTPQDLTQIRFDSNKGIKRKTKFKKPMADDSTGKSSVGPQSIHKSSFKIRKFLYDFCTDFLTNCYNDFMRQIKDSLSRNLSQENDETYYLWAIQFFMEFNRCNTKTLDNSVVSETMSVPTFHFLQIQIERYLDLIKQQKDELILWSKRLHYGLRAYRELLFSLNYFDCVRDEGMRKKAQMIKREVFYDVDYRDLLLLLLHDYNEAKMSKAFLKDLIETNHVFLKMLENYYKHNSKLTIREKVRKIRRKRSQKKKPKDKTPPEEVWNEIVATVSEALQGSIELPSPQEDVSVRAFDATSEKTTDEQKMEVLKRVHHFLEQKLVAKAIALYRDARNCWSGDADYAFGALDIAPEEELLSLNEVLMTEFPNESINEEQNEEEVEEEVETPESNTKTREREVELNEVINKYCQPIVLRNYGLLLKSYDTNSAETNHCIVKMLHRIAFDSKMHAMLFQASLFRTFQRILSDPLLHSSDSIKELSKFVKYIVSKFVCVAEKNKKVFIEMFFWKNSREAYEVEEGYEGNHNNKHVKELWTEEQELELNVLFDEYKDKSDSDKDYIDLILEHMIDETKTRRQLIKQLKRQGLFIKLKPKYKRKQQKKNDLNEELNQRSDDNSDYEELDNNLDKDLSDEEVDREMNRESIENSEESVINENKESTELSPINDTNEEMVETNAEIEEFSAENSVNYDSDDSAVLEIDETVETIEKKRVFDDSDDEEIIVFKKKKRVLIIDDE